MSTSEYGSDLMLNKLEGKNWVATMMLCWTLGYFGAHRFYTGKTTTAWVMAAMTITCCLAPVSAIWALVDGFMIALGNWKHEDGSELYERIPWLGYVYIAMVVLAILYVIFQLVLTGVILGGALSGAGSSVPTVTP
ncbi:TM2 domain-containing protein [bacterium]|nr:TM2 domain-containing protein [bacterium]